MKPEKLHDELRLTLTPKEESFMITIEDILNDYASKDLGLVLALIEVMIALKKTR